MYFLKTGKYLAIFCKSVWKYLSFLFHPAGRTLSSDFLDRGRPKGANVFFGQFFPENCMKMKQIGPGMSRVPHPLPLGSINGTSQRSECSSCRVFCVFNTYPLLDEGAVCRVDRSGSIVALPWFNSSILESGKSSPRGPTAVNPETQYIC